MHSIFTDRTCNIVETHMVCLASHYNFKEEAQESRYITTESLHFLYFDLIDDLRCSGYETENDFGHTSGN